MGAVAIGNLAVQPAWIENPIDAHQDVVVRNQPRKRVSDERLQLDRGLAFQYFVENYIFDYASCTVWSNG